jgi:predicted nucleic acid-binding Zn ribbon protein
VDLAPEERARRNLSQPAQLVLQRVVERLGLDRRRSDAELVKVWNDLIDPAVTAHAQPTRLVRGTLFVTVDSSAWLSEIVRYRHPEILEQLQHSFGRERVKKIAFRAA